MPNRSVRTLLLLAAAALQAQNPVVSGRVLDAPEAAVPTARVEMINRNTGVRSETGTNAEGTRGREVIAAASCPRTAPPGFAVVCRFR